MSNIEELIAELRSHANADNVAGMARFGINPRNTLGVSMPILRALARRHRRDHELAQHLWASGIHEARILATLVDDPARVTRGQMDRWVRELDSWDTCDQACQNLFRYTPFAFEQAHRWAKAKGEFVRRAGFALMAGLAVKAKNTADAEFEASFPLIREAATDERNFVRKAVNWALRQIGKRNDTLRRKAIVLAEEIRMIDSPAARWIASDALRELRGVNVPAARERVPRPEQSRRRKTGSSGRGR
jgi:3-methyladenine DNA glycosylase AlkD